MVTLSHRARGDWRLWSDTNHFAKTLVGKVRANRSAGQSREQLVCWVKYIVFLNENCHPQLNRTMLPYAVLPYVALQTLVPTLTIQKAIPLLHIIQLSQIALVRLVGHL